MTAATSDRYGEVTDRPVVPKVSESARVLRQAEALVTGDRRVDYGDASESFQALAAIWTRLLGLDKPLSPSQVAVCLAALKLWRCSTSPGSFDSWVDMAGYAALGWECAVAEAAKAPTMTSRQATGDPNS